MDENLEPLMQELGNAINDSFSNSDRIAEAINEIKAAGYDVFLILEATIGFTKLKEGRNDEGEAETEALSKTNRTFESTGKIKFTSQDQRFLRAFKIAPNEDTEKR